MISNDKIKPTNAPEIKNVSRSAAESNPSPSQSELDSQHSCENSTCRQTTASLRTSIDSLEVQLQEAL